MKSGYRNRLLIFLLIFFFGTNSFAQYFHSDTLRSRIARETNDTIKIKLLIDLAINYFKDESEHLGCLKEAYELSKETHFSYGLAFGQYYEGLLLESDGKFDEAIIKYKQCIDLLDSLNVIQSIDSPLCTIRFLYNKAGRQEEKFRYYLEKLSYYKNHGPVENTADCYHAIAGNYILTADYDKAIGYYLRAMEVYKTFDLSACANEKHVIGGYYMEWGNTDKAEFYLKSAIDELISLHGEPFTYFTCYQTMGYLYLQKRDYHQALRYFAEAKKSGLDSSLYLALNLVGYAEVYLHLNLKDSAKVCLDVAEKIRKKDKLGFQYPNGMLEIDYGFYKYYDETGDYKLALNSLQAALQEAQSSRFLPLVLKYTNELYSCILKNGDSLNALPYLIRYQVLRDSLDLVNAQARIATFEIEQEAEKRDNEIGQLQAQKSLQRRYYLIGGGFLLLLVIGIASRLLYKRKRDKEQLTTEFKKQLAQAETRALRAQMNPHFIFNCLNSINSFVIDQEHELASEYLIKFSKLIRLILDNSRSEMISLDKELETLKLYVLLESARFDNKFLCEFHVASDVQTDSVLIPPMLLQPFVENAIWHGLMHKEGEGTISIDIRKENEEFLNISIMDDGIGRERAAELKSKSASHKSHGLKVTSERIDMMNRLNSTGARVNIYDLKDHNRSAIGTKVELIIPF
jgi:tetratricopeptide (TPR) repeat protein